eukprot:scaffold1429_cov110-Cylindrotheca_fusiformis.AAC.14
MMKGNNEELEAQLRIVKSVAKPQQHEDMQEIEPTEEAAMLEPDGRMDEVEAQLHIVERVAKPEQREGLKENEPSEHAAMLAFAGGADEETDKEYSNDEVVLSASLTKNTYSIIYVADAKSWAFVFGLSFFVIQTALPVLALSNLIDPDSKNYFKAPSDVDRWDRTAGYLTVAISVPLFPDLLDSIETIHEGYHPVVMKQTPHATFKKWALACGLQLLSGLMLQFVIFLLIVQSTTVIAMLLNFAALAFITEIDDVAFSLAERGYLSDSLQQACVDVTTHKTPDTKGPWLRRLALLFFVLAVLTGYTIIFRYERLGEFLCSRMEVQFGDAFWSELPLFSGVYTVDRKKRENRRLVYRDEATGGETAIFRYCFSQRAFVFGPFNYSKNLTSADDYYGELILLCWVYLDTAFLNRNLPTRNQLLVRWFWPSTNEICNPSSYYLKSPTTESFDVLEARAMDWLFVRSDDANYVNPVEHLYMQCLDCEEASCNQPLGGSCGKNSKCICNEGFFGNQCQFTVQQICNVVEFDNRYDPFPVPGDPAFPSQFQLVIGEDGPTLYRGKAIYAFSYPEGDPSFGYLTALVYLGRRYYCFQFDWIGLFPEESQDGATARFVEYIRENLKQGYAYDRTVLFPLFVSEALDTASSRDKPTPADVGWFYTTQDIFGTDLEVGAPISTRLLCDRCNENEHCEVGGTCNNESDLCVCDDNFVGPRCELYIGA